MTTSFVPPNDHPPVDHAAATIHRPRITFAPQAGPVPLRAVSSSTWKAGWVVSGLAAVLSVGALSVVGVVAYDAFGGSDPAPESASISAPAPATDGGPVASPAPDVPAPAIAVAPALPGSAPAASAPRVIVIPGPAAGPAAKHDPVVTPADPVVTAPDPVLTSPKPPVGIGTCDLVACDSTTPAPGIPKCGDLVACEHLPPAPAPTYPTCGDLVACEHLPAATRP